MEKKLKKELIIKPEVKDSNLKEFVDKLQGINFLYINPLSTNVKNFKTIYESNLADITICHSQDDLIKYRKPGHQLAYYKKIISNKDIADLQNAESLGASYVIIDSSDWKIIPLENIIANMHNSNIKILTTAKNSDEVKTMFSVLELGVDGVILSTDDEEAIKKSQNYLENKSFPIKACEIVEVKDAGVGERVCVDTVSMLEHGEGMLIGSKSNFMFILHNESAGSSFTSPRPFRVNAGAVYCYTLLPDGKTKYLSELESGTEVLIVDTKGNSRSVAAGRCKIETRPLTLVKAICDGIAGTVIVQNAETIQFITEEGNLLPVTSVKKGDKVLGFFKNASGRHFGIEVNEFILEK